MYYKSLSGICSVCCTPVANLVKNVVKLRGYSFVTFSQAYSSYTSFRKQKHEQLLVQSYGEPQEVVIKQSSSLPDVLKANQVIAKVLASPINPADINTIQGVYGIKPNFPFVPGNEAVLEVVSKGEEVTGLKVGDRIIPKHNALGTWRTAVVGEENLFIKIPSDIEIVAAATVAINPCTAFRMLTDFVDLKAGDTVIQNCANSAVGVAAIQIAAASGIQTINIVRQRPNFEELKTYLTSIGATLVLQDSDIRSSKELLKNYPKPLLGLNGVSGKIGTELVRLLDNGGTLVTYGGMSRQPLTVPVGALIFNDITLKGYWMSKWSIRHEDHPKRASMFEYLFDLYRQKKLLPPPHELVPFQDYKRALRQAMPAEGMVGKKQILVFE